MNSEELSFLMQIDEKEILKYLRKKKTCEVSDIKAEAIMEAFKSETPEIKFLRWFFNTCKKV
jgi:hypothetical protein